MQFLHVKQEQKNQGSLPWQEENIITYILDKKMKELVRKLPISALSKI